MAGAVDYPPPGAAIIDIEGEPVRETKVFFRDDDVGAWTDPLRFHVELMIEYTVPCHYLVVPAYLDDTCARALRDLKQRAPALVHFNQHGFTHEQQVGGEIVYSEFAGGRPYADQRADIEKGRDQLAERLGEAFEGDVFTPPCHKYDEVTLEALRDLGFDTLSAGIRVDPVSRLYYGIGRALRRVDWLGKRVSYHCEVVPRTGLNEVSATIDSHEDVDEQGVRVEKTADQLWAEFEGARRHLDVVGIMNHHQACETPEKQAALRTFVARLAADPSVRFADLLDLAPERRAA